MVFIINLRKNTFNCKIKRSISCSR